MVPDFGGLIWMFIAIIEAIIFIAVALTFYFYVLPPIARKFIKAKFSKRSVAFIQHAGKVHLCINKTELPEGVIENQFGWFMKSANPYKGEPVKEKRGPGRPRKDEQVQEETDKEAENKVLEVALETPILDGLNKHVLFGSTDTSLVSNLEAISANTNNGTKTEGGVFTHAVLNALKSVIPATMSRTQVDAIATLNYLRGLKVRGSDMMKLIIVVVAVIGVIGSIGLVFWFLTQGGK